MKFEYELKIESMKDSTLIARLNIHEQPEGLPKTPQILFEHNEWKIKSFLWPEIVKESKTIFIKGSDKYRRLSVAISLSVVEFNEVLETLKNFQLWVEENIVEESKETYNLVLCRHNDDKQYLFRVPSGATLEPQQPVFVNTQSGEKRATTTSKNFVVTEDSVKSIMNAFGAYEPLKYVLGTAVVKEVCEKFKER